jgi:hypothetical protein
MEISQGSSNGKTRAFVICPDTPRSLRFLVSIDLSSSLDDSVLFNLSVRFVICRQLEGTDFGLLGMLE